MSSTTLERFSGKFVVNSESGCWEWTSSRRGNGYGAFHLIDIDGKRRCVGAHRMSWQLHRGDITDGLWVLHKCDNRVCVNPDHLFLGDRSANMRDCAAKGRVTNIGRSRLTHCKNGHAFSVENTRRTNVGHRRCITCDREYSRRSRARFAAIRARGET